MNFILNFLTVFLVINAIFWGLFCHKSHCKIANLFGVKDCPPHWTHILFGIVCFIIAILIEQRNYIFNK